MIVGELPFECAICGIEIGIPISAELKVENGRAYVTTSAEPSDIWLHAWTEHMEEMGDLNE